MIYLILSIYYSLFSTKHTYVNTNSKPNQALQHWNFSLYGTVATKKVIISMTDQRQSFTVDVHSGRNRFNRDAKWSWQTILAYKLLRLHVDDVHPAAKNIFFNINSPPPSHWRDTNKVFVQKAFWNNLNSLYWRFSLVKIHVYWMSEWSERYSLAQG